MSTAITADDLIAAFKKRGVRYRFYKDYADFKAHNRNKAGANAGVTPGGFGPVMGIIWHNFGSAGKDVNQEAYLYRGDGPTSKKPGPLCLGGVADDGTIVLMGWGTATHAGPADPKAFALLKANAMPLDREYKPVTNGTMSGTKAINPFFLGFEMEHGPEGPTAAQRKSLVLASAAILEMLGGPAKGYGAGSIAMHRELTTNRSDPQGVPKDGAMRREVNNLLRQWSVTTTPTPPPAPSVPVAQKPTEVIVTLDKTRITANQKVTVTATVKGAIPGIVKFEWTRPGDSTGWTPFGGDQVVKSGKASVVSTPGDNVVYRAKFYPTDSKTYAADWSPNVAIDVATLAEVIQLERMLAEQAAKVTELQKKLDELGQPTV